MSLGTSPATPVEVWKPNKSNTSTTRTTPCGFLVQNNKCPNPGCDYSHEPWRVRSWQKRNAGKPCRWGTSCPHWLHGNCLYHHRRDDPTQRQGLLQSSEFNRDRVIKRGLRLMERLDLDSLVCEQDPDVLIEIVDKGDLASFNKISDNEIAVPGCPPRFHPITEPLSITLDWHNPTLQQPTSFARYTHAFEPLLRSLETTTTTTTRAQQPFDLFATADLVSNASNLRKLFHVFSNTRRLTERFEMEWRRDTLFLSKWTGDPSLRSSLGHGTGFERETCRYEPDDHEVLRNSSSHHRVVWYTFAGIECVVQSEVDGYFCECHHPPCAGMSTARPQQQQQEKQKQQQSLDTIKTSGGGGGKHRSHRRKSSSASVSSYSSSGTISSTSTTPLSNLNWNRRLSSSSSSSTSSSTSSSSSQFSRFSALLSLDDPGDTPQFTEFLLSSSSSSSSSEHSSLGRSLKVHHLPGRNIPSPCLIEVKTHKAHNRPMFAPEAQLYFCRRTKLFVAQHKAGVFRPPPPPPPSQQGQESAHQSPSITTTTTTISTTSSSIHSHENEQQQGQNKKTPGEKNSDGGGAGGCGGVQDKTEDLIRWEKENQPTLRKVAAFLRFLLSTMKRNKMTNETGELPRRRTSPAPTSANDRKDHVAPVDGPGSGSGISVVIESDGRGGKIKAGLYRRTQNGQDEEDGEYTGSVKSLLPDDV